MDHSSIFGGGIVESDGGVFVFEVSMLLDPFFG